ncbi:M23 family metallopeptidase [Parasegetibacter sp. NRK P23]|uniref:M23 family metallopeptidase n=1 Tax=Parasegetibacter sp. NRK P23 TaxID=2942999 RepID=UPI0020443F67|nr:M23 family metallopeptidase [Parasegetibacter sp. NRK P23]MCM5529088.1 M23 family metallopeptidase [Parasegetibacter sp. NRK P23]
MKAFYPMLLLFLLAGCTGPGKSFLSGKTPHEAYQQKIAQLGLDNSAMGKQWMDAAKKSLSAPASISLPYTEKGYFSAETPGATGYSFSVKRGEMITASLEANPDSAFRLFMELWARNKELEHKLVKAADTTYNITFEVPSDGIYQLRIQPELLSNGNYTLTIQTGPSLAFPVPANANPRTTSFWGAARDGGNRSHEGVDIFAAKRTPLLAAADGRILRTGENNLGGKVIFMKPEGKNISLYYAHLDEQLVSPGQTVQQGDTIGLMGNTGNARTTPPHLHFGIYTGNGAIDPYPFINNKRPATPTLQNTSHEPGTLVRTNAKAQWTNAINNKDSSLPANTLLYIQAIAPEKKYKTILPNGHTGFISTNSISALDKPYTQTTVRENSALAFAPQGDAPIKTTLEKGTGIQVLARFNNHLFVKSGTTTGWILNLP